jgi:hypothetical protein
MNGVKILAQEQSKKQVLPPIRNRQNQEGTHKDCNAAFRHHYQQNPRCILFHI